MSQTEPRLLREVLLIDDGSTFSMLKDRFQDYIDKWDGLVHIKRLKTRTGLIQAKTYGAKEAQGEILVFLDAHVEVQDGIFKIKNLLLFRNFIFFSNLL